MRVSQGPRVHGSGQHSVSKIVLYTSIVIVTALITALFIYLYNIDDTVKHRSLYDDRHYEIRNADLKQQAADHLSIVYNKVMSLVQYMKVNGLPNQTTSDRLYDRWINCRLRETSINDNSVAFTVNKGYEMRLCIRTGSSFEDQNTSLFVVLHELAHIMSVSYGHNDEFNENFNYIVHLASQLGIYVPKDFSKEPEMYCGTYINTTPCSRGTCSGA
jgi:hypothetical protein